MMLWYQSGLRKYNYLLRITRFPYNVTATCRHTKRLPPLECAFKIPLISLKDTWRSADTYCIKVASAEQILGKL